jgi:hypothetical protein
MHLLTIDGSPTQIRKLRKGHAVRIKKGTGFNLIVSPQTYHLASRAFNKGKGTQVKLTPEEIAVNQRASMEPSLYEQHSDGTQTMAGRGIFGKAFDRFLKKTGLNKITDPLGKVLKPVVKKGIQAATTIGANTLGKLIPGGDKIAKRIGDFAEDYIDNPSLYNEGNTKTALSRIGKKLITGNTPTISESQRSSSAPSQTRSIMTPSAMPSSTSTPTVSKPRSLVLGTGMNDVRMNAAKGYARANAMNSEITGKQIQARKHDHYPSYSELKQQPFAPFSRGYGMHPRTSNSIVGRGGGMLSHYMPPALVSQPFSANYQMSHFLPPHFQHYNNSPQGMGLGMGLYM